MFHALPKYYLQAAIPLQSRLRWVFLHRCQKDENIATASNSPPRLELNPSPPKLVKRPEAGSQIWNYKTGLQS